MKIANEKCDSMVRRGGGVVDITAKILNPNKNVKHEILI